MVKLSVNINKIATLRNARGENNPDVLKAALDIESYGANGITVHPRPDQRHIRYDDVYAIKKKIKVELNIEGYPSKEYVELIKKVKPSQATLVPDAPGVLTSDAGWEVEKNRELLGQVVGELKKTGARVSLFIDPDKASSGDLKLARELGAARIELYTKKYADEFAKGNGERVIIPYRRTAKLAGDFGLEINAGHDLNLDNLNFFVRNITNLKEVSIGHALICDALYFGLKRTVERYLEQVKI
ncbi:MAG: pyridoxine 5'-phosphate synthase [Proteobacteria bacterium SG_bin7]|nr:MAG: pyridoxine 5'-phosphate synthase [Proteobacteria bacterium SG_bin7]